MKKKASAHNFQNSIWNTTLAVYTQDENLLTNFDVMGFKLYNHKDCTIDCSLLLRSEGAFSNLPLMNQMCVSV